MAEQKVAIITGGASGMGLAVAHALNARGSWSLHLLDLNAAAGSSAISSLGPNAHFHPCNVTSYASLSTTFETIFQSHKRLDFVFANAGIAERANFYAVHETGSGPPPELDLLCVHISLDAVISTSYLALHYFRQSGSVANGEKNLVMTASCGGLYPSYYSPTYSAAKHGVVGFMRSIAKQFWMKNGIRVNAICPGTVKTNLLTSKEWENFPEEYFTPVEAIVKTVVMLVDGLDEEKGEKEGVLWGKAVEISGTRHYYRTAPEYCDEAMRAVMSATDIEELEH